ncbi:MAG TPA: hypothetical protein VGM59_05600 [Dongiaceae bacterium]|jgi:hypothetical protein
MRLKVSLFAAAAALVLPVCAQAATITSTYSFTADNFHSEHLPSTPPPISSIAGTFTITFDPTQASTGTAVFNVTTGSLPNSGNIQFSFDPASYVNGGNNYTGFLLLGDALNGLNSVDETTNDFSFAIDNFSSGSPIAKIIYGNASGDNYDSSSVSVVAATPIPATLPLLATGILGLVGFGVYSSRRAAKPNAEAVPA